MEIVSSAEFLRRLATQESTGERPELRKTVSSLVEQVRIGGDRALRQLTQRLDRVQLKTFRVAPSELRRAWDRVPAPFRRALQESARNIQRYQASLLPRGRQRLATAPGVELSTRWVPLPAVACYAPGGRAAYPSTVLMMAVTARVAGVRRVVLLSPPQADGKPSDAVLAAAHLARVDEVFAVGGAQAIAAVAYGTQSIPRVPKVVGPGNAYVTEAKRQLFGTIGIDSIAGPTELAIYADASVKPDWVAVDLAAQAEHDPDARVVLVVRSARLGRRIREEVRRVVRESGRREILERSLVGHGLIVVATSEARVVQALDAFAPEHVEVLCRTPERVASRLSAAGTIFLGPYAPAPMGDYVTGANHVLPTGRSARWASPLSVFDFMRQVVTQRIERRGVRRLGPSAIEIAIRENLPLHAETIRRRIA